MEIQSNMKESISILKGEAGSDESFGIVLRHSLEVLAKAMAIVAKKQLWDEVDMDLVASGSLLHDVGAFRFLEDGTQEGYIRHGVLGAELLRGMGREREARIAERHTGAGLSQKEIIARGWDLPLEDLLPETLEEKLICYADKFSSKTPGKKDTLESIEKEFEGYGQESLERFRRLREMFE